MPRSSKKRPQQTGKTTSKSKKSSDAIPTQATKSTVVISPGAKLTQIEEIDREKTLAVERTKRLEALIGYQGVLTRFFTLYGGLGKAKIYLKTIFIQGYSHAGMARDQYYTCSRFVDDLVTLIQISERYSQETFIPELFASLTLFDARGLPISQFYTVSPQDFGNSFWDEFPRYLTKEEYAAPEIVLRSFYEYVNKSSWEHFLRDLWCSINSQLFVLMDLECKRNPIGRYDHALKFVEALHLIKVRLSQVKLP
jgi:hypothetical protein